MQGLVVFTAPTRPLVEQQRAACARALGLAAHAVVELTGGARPDDRRDVWADPGVRVVFTTPQALKNDVCLGVCPFERITCLVVDECHRAVGRSDGAVALQRLAAAGVKFRCIGLSATPGATREAVQARGWVKWRG